MPRVFFKVMLLSSGLMFFLCLFLQAVEIGNHGWSLGGELLLLGWLGVLFGHFTWLANLIWLIAWLAIYIDKPVAALSISVAAFLLAGSFVFHETIVWNEAGLPSAIRHYGAGYYLWLVSILAQVVGIYGLKNNIDAYD